MPRCRHCRWRHAGSSCRRRDTSAVECVLDPPSAVCDSVSMSDRAISDRAVSRCVAAMCCRVLCPALCVGAHHSLAVAVRCVAVHRSRRRVCDAQGCGSLLHHRVADRRSVMAVARSSVAGRTPPSTSPCVPLTRCRRPSSTRRRGGTSPCTTRRARRHSPSSCGCCCRIGGAALGLPPSPTRWRRPALCTVT
jgi:hypothetical protein